MNIQETFCPRCGAPSPEGLCPACRVAETRWLECEGRIACVQCPTCFSIRQGKVWSDLQTDREGLIRDLALSAVRLHPEVTDVRTGIWFEEVSPNRTACTVEVHGRLYGLLVHDLCRVEIVWQREQCNRCSRISGGYYEGVVQIRAAGRGMTPHEREAAIRIAEEAEGALQASGERLSFVSGIEEIHDGLDIVVGSQHMGQVLCQALAGELGGRCTTHPKLVGERDGRQVYRITYALRLPFYRKGDIVLSKGTYYEVRKIEPQHLAVFNLMTGTGRALREEEVERRIGNVSDAESALVTYTSGDTVGVLDPATFAPRDIPAVPWLFPVEGAPVRVIRDPERDELIMIG
ncbi:MAG: 60S ribosomal export protein NMD3 [Methanomicrobiaceae archaeon]|nr:60S ribosomal export protein NMD3 [Methanomicrobiaceae archaeon]